MNLLPIGFKFIFLLVIIGGIIAVIADELGRKLGKKRLSLFGLRPKHTARIGTFLMGMVVTIFTVLMVAVMSRGVRQWILQGDQAIIQRDEVLRKLAQAKSQLDNVRKQYQKDQAEIAGFQHRIALGNSQIEIQRTSLVELNKKQAGLQKRIQDTNRKYSETSAKLAVNERHLAENQLKLIAVTRQLKDATKQLNGTVAELNKSRSHGLALQINIQELQKEITTQTNDLRTLKTQEEDLQFQKDSLSKELTAKNADLSHVYDEVFAEQQNLDQLKKQEEDIQKLIFQNFVGPSRVNPMIFGIGQEVSRLSVPDHLTKEEAEAALNTLLKQAGAAAVEKGARGDAEYPAADIYKHDEITPQEWRDKWVDQLTGQAGPQVAIAESYANAFRGEHVAVVIDVRDNPRVFRKGELVAESPIDGAGSLGAIYDALRHFLTNEVQTRAKERKMIPVDADLGAVSADQVLQTVQTIKSANRPVRLEAVAIGDTYAADPLKLDLQVR